MEGSGVSSGSKSLMICLTTRVVRAGQLFVVEYLLQVPKGQRALQHQMHRHPGRPGSLLWQPGAARGEKCEQSVAFAKLK
jgi:hypothetical protein